MPLSAGGLWLAEIIIPPMASVLFVTAATQGVGHKPKCQTSKPAAVKPEAIAIASISLELRES